MPSPRAVLNDSKKGYTLKEKFDIVHYIIKRDAYNDVRGRSFWLEMEKARIAPRTWQSLKEVFLKRILPDLRNPYYKLTQDQIRAFASRSAPVTKGANSVNWVEKNKAMNKILNRTLSEQNQSPTRSNAKRIVTHNAKQSGNKSNEKRSSSTDSTDDTDLELLSSPKTSANNSQKSKNNDERSQDNMRITRNRDKENSTTIESSQDSQPIESFPTNALPTSTPRKSLLRSNNFDLNKRNSPNRKNVLPKSASNSPSKQKSPSKLSSKTSQENNRDESKSSEKSSTQTSPQVHSEKHTFSPNFLFLSSSDSSLSDSSADKKNKSKRNLFGFGTGVPSTSIQQVAHVSSETDMSSEIIVNDRRPVNLLYNRQKSFNQESSSDSDDEKNSSRDSQYTCYRNSDSESLKRKGKKLFGLYRGKLVPLYEPRKKCCINRKELIAKGKIAIKSKSHKGYVANELNGGQQSKKIVKKPFDGDDNVLTKEVLNFWKLKYLSLKRRNDEIMRLLAKQRNETYIDSVTKMLTDPIKIPDTFAKDGAGKDDHVAPLANESSQMIKRKRPPSPSKPNGTGKKFLIASSDSQKPGSSKKIAENDNVVVIDSQKADIIIDILKKVSEMNQPIDPIKVNSLMRSPKSKSVVLPKQDEIVSTSTDPKPTLAKSKPSPKHENKTASVDVKSNSKDAIPEEILRLREKERQIFEKIESENVNEKDVNTNRDLFTKSELELLFNEKESGKRDDRKKDYSSSDNQELSNSKNLRPRNKKEPTDKPVELNKDAGPSTNNKMSDSLNSSKSSSSKQKTNKQSVNESNMEDTNKSNYLPESMELESIKYAINPKFFSILFPPGSEEKNKTKNSFEEIIPSSDDDTTRYALPKMSSMQIKKQNKNRRSTGKVIKLKMFSNVKKDKRQSFCNNENVSEGMQKYSEIEKSNYVENEDLSVSSHETGVSLEIPIQKFIMEDNYLESLTKSSETLNYQLKRNHPKDYKMNINLDKPLLEQELECIRKDGTPEVMCRFCNLSENRNSAEPKIMETLPLTHMDVNVGFDQNVLILEDIVQTLELENPLHKAKILEPNVTNNNSIYHQVQKDDRDIAISSDQTDSQETSSLNASNTSIFNSFFQSDVSSSELNLIY